MKPAKFGYVKPKNLSETLTGLSREGTYIKVLAGSQSLGPMMNLRLARPDFLIDIRGLDALRRVMPRADYLFVGALITHSEIEDGLLPDITKGMLTHIAAGIAYRAVRNRGTIGGSIVHADPAGDWPAVLRALGAEVEIEGQNGTRVMAISAFQLGAYTVALEDDEIVCGFRIPVLSNDARWGYHKICRKPGEFAQSIGAFVCDPQANVVRLVLAATTGGPIELSSTAASIGALEGVGFDIDAAREALIETGEAFEPFEMQMHALALHRAVSDAYGA